LDGRRGRAIFPQAFFFVIFVPIVISFSDDHFDFVSKFD
jgi:hypothetical protein